MTYLPRLECLVPLVGEEEVRLSLRLVRDPWFADESGATPRLRHGDRRSGSMTPHREMSFNPDLLIFTVPFPVRAAPEAAPVLNCAHSVSLFDRHFLYRSHAAPRPRPNSEHYVASIRTNQYDRKYGSGKVVHKHVKYPHFSWQHS